MTDSNKQDWASHKIAQELSLAYRGKISHGETVALVYPHYLKIMEDLKGDSLKKCARDVFELPPEKCGAHNAIEYLTTLIYALGGHTLFSEYSLEAQPSTEIPNKLERQGMLPLGETGAVGKKEVREILRLAARV